MNETGKTSFYRNAGIRKHLDAFNLTNIPFLVYDPVIGYFTTPHPSGYWDEACDIGGASDPGYNLIDFKIETSADGTITINILTVMADTKAIGSHPLNLKSRGLKGGVPGRDISAELLPGGNMTSNSTGSSGSTGGYNIDFTQGLAYQTTFNGDYTSSGNFNNDLNKTGNSTSEYLNKLNGLNANKAMSLAEEEGDDGGSSSWMNAALEIVNKVSTFVGSVASITQQTIKKIPDVGYVVAYNSSLMKASKIIGFLGPAGDAVSISSAIIYLKVNWNTASKEQNFVNVIEVGVAGIGLFPIAGDAFNLWYMGVKELSKTEGFHNIVENDFLNTPAGRVPWAHCFAEGSKVIMADRTIENIENLNVGDTILNYNFDKKKFEKNRILKIEKAQENNLIEIVFENYIIIVSTEDHPYYVKDKGLCSFNPVLTFNKYGIKTKKLEVYDYCFFVKNKKVKKIKIVQLNRIKKLKTIYNISEISNSNNYFINGILINNGN